MPAETFAYRKLMGPESSGRVRGVGSRVTSNQLHAKHSGQSGTESSGIVILLLKEVQSLRQEVAYLKAQRSDNAQSLSQGDDGEDNQRPLTPSDTECIRHPLTPTTTLTTNHGIHTKDVVTSDTSGVVHASRSPNIVHKANQQRSSDIISAGGKENIQLNRQRSTTQGKENVQVGEQSTPMRENEITSQCLKKPSIVQSLNFDQREQLNRQRSTAQGKENVQVGEQSTPMRENEITSQCSKKPNIVRNLNFDQREQLNCIQKVRKDPSLPSMPSSLNEEVFGDNCKRVMGSTCNQRVQNSLSATKRKEVGTSNFQPTIDLPKKQVTQKKLVQNQSLLPQGDRAEIEKLVDKVIEENLDTVKSFRNPRRREFAHCFLGGMAFLEGKKMVDKDLLSQILYEKLFATLVKQPADCNSGVNIFQ